ncbi:hypothetical protein [Actinoplanes solisilvae]|uniref:hypothetical protein n=1 Tax=Actinoplanes solisilvae TaxID=2486853 RepID=UPI001F0C1827|nr:hypothetical protein [Actinoplanes solisilvae]
MGSPETVARKIAKTIGDVGIQRFDLKFSTGALPHEAMMRTIELYGTEVIPRVRKLASLVFNLRCSGLVSCSVLSGHEGDLR